MPKKVTRDKRSSRKIMRTGAGLRQPRVDSVKDLLKRTQQGLTRITVQAARRNFWNDWLSQHLPVEIRAKVSGVIERDGELVILAESAAWSARLRYAVLELESAIREAGPELSAIVVRVLPRG